jgi:hypothetical protein
LVTITVDSVNDAPTLTPLANQTFTATQISASQTFTIGDVETPVNSLTFTLASTNTVLVPVGNIAIVGTGATRSIVVTPTASITGTAGITLSVSDGITTTSQFFMVIVAGESTYRVWLPLIRK